MKKILFLFFVFSAWILQAQSTIIGKIVDENGTPISGIFVINLRTNQNLYSDSSGDFLIPAHAGDILRFVSNGFERQDQVLSSGSFGKNLVVTLLPKIQEIAQVNIKFSPTGDLHYDLAHLPKNLKNEEVNYKVQQSIAMGPSDKNRPRMNATPGVRDGSNFKDASITINPAKVLSFLGIGKKEKDVALPPLRLSGYAPVIYHILGDQFFTDLKISKDEIQPFITYALIHETRNPNRDVVKVLKQRDWSTVREILRAHANEYLSELTTTPSVIKEKSPI